MKEKIRVGILGLGRAGWKMHVPELEQFPDMFEITACCDVIPERMARLAERCPGCRGYDSWEGLFHAPEVDLVSVAVRSPQHVEAATQALEAGKYVLIEKPLGLNYAEILNLKAASEKHPGKLFCRHNRRFESAFQHVREIIASGKLGNVYEIKLCRHGYGRRNDWQSLTSCGGGQLNNWGPHLIDHACQFLEAPVESVWGDLKRIAATGDAEDHFKAVIRGTNGRIVDIEVSGGVAIPSPVYAVYGNRGSLVAYDEKELHLKYLDVEKCSPDPVATGATPAQEASYGDNSGLVWIEETIPVAPALAVTPASIYKFIYLAIREGQPFPVTNEEAFENVRVTELIRGTGRIDDFKA